MTKVIFAKDRTKRPMDKVINENEESIIDEYNERCPFCKGNENNIQNENLR